MAEPTTKATPRLRRSDRRAQLLAAAKGAFVTQGYHAAAMDDIAERAGVSKPVLYQHFPSKLELYLALLGDSADEMVRMVEGALHETDDNDERVHRAVEAYFSTVADSGQAYRLIFESDLRGQPQVEEIVDRATDSCIAAITATITTDTGVDPERSRLLAAALVGLSQVSARYWLTQSPGVPRAEAIEIISTLAWRGISRFPRQA
ncbi:DNA-binding transcriptional regulator, AcrR family [Nakamurella panacisegetis]|uniref:DNA-binding transcriptional regulator, AcrR family n=1 Tax=Nakamurella panacisegetis TaxID=1090615 RepID=A0A1H0SN81_9ACTN|nr:TetR/AcrR family transcriptional regulator [Nakamurella panacisegetis]SDP43133.1 DNA-binding transcriptional regulator, AcrR family [Nakamurella panacisegetis]